jgi:hypothetical protein
MVWKDSTDRKKVRYFKSLVCNPESHHFVPWHSKHDTPTVPPFKSEPWQLTQFTRGCSSPLLCINPFLLIVWSWGGLCIESFTFLHPMIKASISNIIDTFTTVWFFILFFILSGTFKTLMFYISLIITVSWEIYCPVFTVESGMIFYPNPGAKCWCIRFEKSVSVRANATKKSEFDYFRT